MSYFAYLSVGMDKQGEKRAVARLFSAIGRCQEAPVSGFEPSVRVPKQCRRTARRRGNPSGRGGALQAPHRTRLVLQNTGNFPVRDVSACITQ